MKTLENLLFQRDIISSRYIQLNDIQLILDTAFKIKLNKIKPALTNKIIAHCFFEPSTRTRLSFETASLKLGAQNIGFSDSESLSLRKGESLADTICMVDEYADLIVMRHPREGAAQLAADIAHCPVINAGDGANQHPTQALIDLFSIQECQGKIDGLSIALAGDLKYARTIHSLVEACSLFEVRLYLISPEILSLPNELCDLLKQRGIRFSFHQSIEEIISKVDIIYLTRIQRERCNISNNSLITNQYKLTLSMLSLAKPNLKILHPLPRVNEIELSVDETEYAYYFQQAKNGVPVRQALLSLILSESIYE
jgi:aspartate carbamoyltransferase catalytic subunit